ncbi:hypothetical protein LTS03_001769 [Exophiala xenobiotica]|nr:hypothetical protein LTS06_004340 [Exophiala xenobiotica]KAK5385573.1 hypothetical protein LTR11_001947 [Exophiala xenobiotica]KAK5386496.1 hypothetical protein LTS03_001769 [Exophiala xenobiotica]
MDTAVLVEHNMEPQHMSPNPLRCPPPSAPLHQLSPERINQQRMPMSPSLPSFANENERRRTRDSFSSDVQSKVAFLNSLAYGTGTGSVQSSPTRPSRGNANNNNALQRAVMGYEEAQASLATLTAELERAKEEMSSRKKRERMLAQRVDELLEDLQTEKKKRCRDQESYAKEIKRCRKEAYRAELAVVEARQDLQEARSELKRSQAEVQHEKVEKEKSRQESFERAYALAGVVGELEQLKDRLKVTEKERDAALMEVKANTVEMNVSTEAENQIATSSEPEKEQPETRKHTEQQPETTMSLKRSMQTMEEPVQVSASMAPRDILKFTLDIYDKRMHGEKLTPQEEIRYLKQELRCARQKHAEDADMMHFMHMQCQFKACPCRLAEEKGDRFVHDYAYEAAVDQARALKKRKISNQRTEPQSARVPFEEKATQANSSTDVPFQNAPQALPVSPEDEATYRLPPDPTLEQLSRISEEPLLLEEAVEVPLPEPQPMELDSREVTPERTAQLEEITQVIVEPGTTSKPFSFSTSTTSNPALRATTPSLIRHTESATALLEYQHEQEHDLFDLSPPKQAPPRRPSTAMGILTIDSPIRLVPDSPRSLRTSEHETTRSMTPTYDYHHNHTITTTTKIALKGSPQRNSLHRRAQSRPDLRSHSPLRSSAMSHVSDADAESFPRPVFAKDTSASSASTTLFPVTPLHKHAKSAQLAQSQPRPAPAATTSITTRVPLKGLGSDAEGNDEYSGQRYNYGHAHTEVLNVNFNPDVHMHMQANPLRTSTASNGSDTFSNRASQAGTIPTSILGSVPGTPISREAALAQIRARRDRARSVNLKQLSSISTGKENGLTGSGKPGSPTKPKVVVGGAGLFGRDKENVRREISQASAPGRFGY